MSGMGEWRVLDDCVAELAEGQFLVAETRREQFLALVKKINTKMVRATGHGISYEVVATGHRTIRRWNDGTRQWYGERRRVEFETVVLHGVERIQREGWQFAGTLQHLDTGAVILRTVPGFERDLPERFREVANTVCDHCGRQQRRRDTYVLSHTDGRWTVVGSTCIREFLGWDPEQELAVLQLIFQIGEYSAPNYETARPDLRTVDFLAHVAAAIRAHGWTPKSSSGMATPTAIRGLHSYCVVEHVEGCPNISKCEDHYIPTPADQELAAAALDWARTTLAEKQTKSDYEHNLVVACASDNLQQRTEGIVASVVTAYQRHQERCVQAAMRAQERSQQQAVSEWVGSEGSRLPVDATVTRWRDIASEWGVSTMIEFSDEHGNVLVWFASNAPEIQIGDRVRLTGTVKRHGEYQGVRQTVMTRCKVAPLGAA